MALQNKDDVRADLPDDVHASTDAAYAMGGATAGSGEAAMPGGMAMNRRWRHEAKAARHETAQYLAEEIGKMGPFEILDGDTHKDIPALSWTIKPGFDTGGYTLYDMADRLRSRGWQVPAYAMPANREDLVIQRVQVRHGVSRDLAALLIEDMHRCLDHFKAHPVSKPMSEEEAGGYHH